MRTSLLARRQQRNHARYRGRNDLNIVPMLDVMVILTFFLIFTAVFSKTSILEVHLPGPGARAASAVPALELEVIVRRSGIEIADRNSGVLERLPAIAAGQDVVQLSASLERLKERFPDTQSATLLVAEDVDYDTIVQVMDAVRVRQSTAGSRVVEQDAVPADRAGRCTDMIRTGMKRHARHGKAGGGHGPLTLIPMIDMLTIMVVYLLVHAADTEILPNTRNISIPQSISEQKPHEATVVTVTRDMLYVDGEAVVPIARIAAGGDPVIEPLRAALGRQAESVLGEPGSQREVTVMAEKSLPYSLLRRIVASCSAADYSKVSLAVVEREQALLAQAGS